MTRPAPLPALGWRIPGQRKVYASRRSAYYALAKELVIAKYPPGLEGWTPSDAVMSNWPWSLVEQRLAKADALFYADEEIADGYTRRGFSPQRWTRFVHRVARFMMYVDDRRELAEQVATLSHAELDREHQHAERASIDLAKRAAELQAIGRARLLGSAA